MDEKGKRKIVGFVKLCWHEFKPETEGIMICISCITTYDANDLPFQLDPTDPADMYGKIWPAFWNNEPDMFSEFIFKWLPKTACGLSPEFKLRHTVSRLTSAPDLAIAILTFIEQKEGK